MGHDFQKKGFTLIETVLTIVIVSIIAGVSAKILLSGLDTYSFITSRKDATQHARVAMDRMVSELTLMESSDIRFISDDNLTYLDSDGIVSSFKTDTANGQLSLVRNDKFLAGPLGFIDFDYLKPDGSRAPAAHFVNRINIELSVDALGGYGSITLRTEVYPRGIMYDNFR